MKEKSNLLVILCVLFITITTNLNAQTRSTVLLNKATDSTKYEFDTKLLPSNSIIPNNNVILNLNVKVNQLNSFQEQMLSIKNDNENYIIGKSSKITNATKSLNIKLNIHDKLPSMSRNLILNTEFSKENIQKKIFFYNSLPNTKNYEVNKQPKLVVNYETTKEPNLSDWEQANANAQHTNAIKWEWNGNFNETYFGYTEYKLTKCISDKTVIYKEKPIIFEELMGNGCQMSLLNYKNNNKLWTLNIPSIPNTYPLLDKQGRMYLFLKNHKMMVIDLETQTIVKNVELNSLNFNSNSNNRVIVHSINNNPTIGYDGTIYLSLNNDNGRMGIVSLSDYTNFKPRWFYNTTNPVSAIALSENEKLAFLIETNTNKKSKLVVLDNLNGSVIAETEAIFSSYLNDDSNSYIPPIVVQKITATISNIFILDGNKSANKLFVFQIKSKITDTQNDKIEVKLIHTITSEKNTSSNTGISQPMVTSSGNVYFIKDNILSKFDTNSQTILPVNCSKYSFSNESVISSNASDQLFIQSNNEVCYVNTKIDDYKVFKLDTKSISNNNHLYVTPNLGIFNLSNDSCKTNLLVNTPNGKDTTIELSALKNNTVHFADKIRIKNNVTINNNTNTILIANRIYLSKGFSIKKGANVSFKIN